LIVSSIVKITGAMAYSISFLWVNELFRTKNRGLGSGFGIFIGRMAMSLVS